MTFGEKFLTKFREEFQIPDRTKIFLGALWIWSWVLLQLTIFANFVLRLIIQWLPNYLMPSIKPTSPVKVIEASDENGNNVKDKLNLFLNLKWDPEMFDNRGGADLDKFLEYLGTSIIWVAYLMEYDKEPSYADVLNIIKEHGRISHDELNELVRIAIIDAKNKIIDKFGRHIRQNEDILFGEVNFH